MHLGAWCPQRQQQEPAHAVPSLQGPKPPDAGARSPSMAEAGSMGVVAQAVIGTPGLAGNVLPTSYIPMLEVP